ncbi:ScbA/BarX family gamma-butyrolactone biosynthesis protein [Streptomyces cellulosae]|uniref:ScbA/BarX family gamma-butyrolactone biosynthesis protein n=1 Tax=Streptomyces cellulosae TaxID=1968 RepID=UPI0006897E44|nr:ScbA/BarX family gamma-butyrolactone biosynthesis protein [Streptomyces cellulosae]
MTVADEKPGLYEASVLSSAAADGLSFESTVERSLVHRAALAEVFITDAERVDDDRYLVAAQLPCSHPYYNDHLTQPAAADSLLLLECGRQAATVVVHRWLDVPAGTSFLVTRWETELVDSPALDLGTAPGELRMLVTTRDPRRRRGELRSLQVEIALHLAGRLVGTSRIGVGYLPGPEYRAFRAMRRTTPPPMSDAPELTWAPPVAPALVGRHDRRNVVLADARRTPDGARALLAPPVSNRGIFDHPLDHVPAMVMVEAARQLAVFAVGEPRYATRLSAAFGRFVELDSPVEAVGKASGEQLSVEFLQDGAVVCTTEVRLSPTSTQENR